MNALLLCLGPFLAPPDPPKLDLKDGDRIVWLGGTLVEREQKYGYWETALHAAFPKVNFTLRNLGWSGDTVFGESRGRFDFNQPNVCFKQLVDQTLALKPTVIFVSYGANESFDGEAGLPKFEQGLNKLLDALKPANARVVLFSPMPVEVPTKFPTARERNVMIEKYAGVVQKVATGRSLIYANLYQTALWQYASIEYSRNHGAIADDEIFTENGTHLVGSGYYLTVPAFLFSLGIRCEIPGCYVGEKLDIPASLKLPREALAPLRKAIVAKNQLFFYRWRPQNETYLTGFRKHEQGKNAKEVAEFDPLVDKAEKEIERIKRDLFKVSVIMEPRP
jgi:GDSL-like Lipase/Acylhydrolase family